jgi:hypothetical protein
MQRKGVDYSETFAPVAKFASIRLLIAIAALYKLRLVQLDVIMALLNPGVEDEIYVHLPEGLTAPMHMQKNKNSQLALHLKKGIHGVKQAPRLYNEAVDRTLQRLQFT